MYILPTLSEYLCHLINYCLKFVIYPSLWNESGVLPLAKKENPLNYNDLRPISILNNLSKIMEKIIFNQFSAYVFGNNIIPQIQSGFRCNFSITTTLLHITDEITSSCPIRSSVERLASTSKTTTKVLRLVPPIRSVSCR